MEAEFSTLYLGVPNWDDLRNFKCRMKNNPRGSRASWLSGLKFAAKFFQVRQSYCRC